MKSLNEYIEERLLFPSQVDEKLVIFPSQVDEKLVINKDYKGFDNRIIDIIKELLDNPEDEDIMFDPSYIIFYFQVINDMIEITYETYGLRTKRNMCEKTRETYKFIPYKISPKNYKRALRKPYIDTGSNYSDEIAELYEYANDNKDKYSIKNCELGDGNLFSMIMNEKYLLSFLLNEKTNEIFELFIIEFK